MKPLKSSLFYGIALILIVILALWINAAYPDSWHSDGTFDRRWYEDTSQSPLSTTFAAANQPDKGGILGSGNLECYLFDGATTEEQLFFVTQVPHGFGGEFLKPHIHAMPTTTGAGSYQFHIEYSIAQPFAAFPNPSTISSSVREAGGTAWVHQVTTWSEDLVPDGYNKTSTSMILVGRLYRDPTDSDDDYAADVCLLDFDLHYDVTSPGSRQEFVK